MVIGKRARATSIEASQPRKYNESACSWQV